MQATLTIRELPEGSTFVFGEKTYSVFALGEPLSLFGLGSQYKDIMDALEKENKQLVFNETDHKVAVFPADFSVVGEIVNLKAVSRSRW